MYIIMIIAILIVFIVLILSVLTTSKAYTYKHKVDSVDNNPYLKEVERELDEQKDTH